ncbi:ATP synthase F0 subunit A [Cytophagales bacterium RKSG123]|nr:ATP synthase F0 subunit A [Xanthovirga aplysinae]
MRGLNKLLKITFLLSILVTFSNAGAFASSEESEGGKTDYIMEHIKDAHDWHLATIGHTHVTIPLPIILYSQEKGLDIFMSSNFYDEHHNHVAYNGYQLNSHGKIEALDGNSFLDISITKNTASLLISAILLFAIFLSVAKRYKQAPNTAPKGLQSFIEPIILFVRDDIAIPNLGEKKHAKFMPYLLTVFFFIWINNLMGLLPGAANLTGNISVTFVLAVFTLIITNVNGNKHYWGHIFNMPGLPKVLLPIMVPIEIIGIFTKPFALMVRLFANITAGHIIILSIIGLIFIFGSSLTGIISVPFATAMNFLELLVAFIQAYVFTLLSAIFIGQAVADDH